MRLALQALFSRIEESEEGTTRRASLERRLRASERSAGFFRRLRDVVDDESLRAPEVFAEESFPDANVVAEYLDGQAPPELARAYEEACLDSPEMLAEIGRCYDILNSDALNCVVVPKNCRRRLYYIAWEEGAVDVASGEENAILTDLAPSASQKTEESKTGEVAQNVKAKREKNRRRAVSKAKEKKNKTALESAKSVNSVGSTLAAERSWGRRVKRTGARLILALGLSGAVYCGWQALDDDRRSETFQIETPKPELAATNVADAPNVDEETPLRPTTISSATLEEIPTTVLTDSTQSRESETFEAPILDLGAEPEPPKLAVLPKVTDGSEVEPNSAETPVAGSRQRVGLGGEEPWDRRPSIEIPAQNNDVFTKTKLY